MNEALEARDGLPEALQFLIAQYPRDIWTGHSNFDGLTRFWLSRHLEFRRGLTLMQSEAQTALDGGADAHLTLNNLSRIGTFMAQALHGHHFMEDTHYFPQFLNLEPALDHGFTLLDADHHALDTHIETMETGTRALSDPTGALADRIGPLRDHLGQFERFLDRHLTDEEDLIVPIILKHGPAIS